MQNAELPKVFGIGFQKTGTSSLGMALRMLGYRVCTMNFADKLEQKYGQPLSAAVLENPDFKDTVITSAVEWAEAHNGFQDMPWFLLYKQMDERYPGSKFVLTTRDLDLWVRSMRSYDRTYKKPRAQIVLRWIFGVGEPSKNEALYRRVHERHIAEVNEYFRGRADNLLVLDMADRYKMSRLCRFLDQRMPRSKVGLPKRYPHQNRGLRNRLINFKAEVIRLGR